MDVLIQFLPMVISVARNPLLKMCTQSSVNVFLYFRSAFQDKGLEPTRISKKSVSTFKDKVAFWSCDCILKKRLWNRSEKV